MKEEVIWCLLNFIVHVFNTNQLEYRTGNLKLEQRISYLFDLNIILKILFGSGKFILFLNFFFTTPITLRMLCMFACSRVRYIQYP